MLATKAKQRIVTQIRRRRVAHREEGGSIFSYYIVQKPKFQRCCAQSFRDTPTNPVAPDITLTGITAIIIVFA